MNPAFDFLLSFACVALFSRSALLYLIQIQGYVLNCLRW